MLFCELLLAIPSSAGSKANHPEKPALFTRINLCFEPACSNGSAMNFRLFRSMIVIAAITCALILVGASSMAAQTSSADESAENAGGKKPDRCAYTLLTPVPPDQMREFQTDRPDKTETPYTLDAGHFAIETSIASYTYNHVKAPDPTRPAHQILIGDNNLKVGLLNNMDLQFLFQSFIWERTKIAENRKQTDWGFGDTEVRLKVNLWGNDSGKTAMAIMPWVGIPTNQLDSSNPRVTGGTILPLAVEGPWGWKIGIMTEFDAVNNSSGDRYHFEWVNSIALHHDLIEEKLDAYVEFFSNNSYEPGTPWTATVDFGLIYEVDKNLFLDCGVNVGVTGAADKLNPFIGLSKRF